jgi:hypothetical protein
MNLEKGDAISGIGTVISAIGAALGYLWNIGLLQLLFSFLAGSFSTFLVQHKLQIESEKRTIARDHAIMMRDELYGPLFEALNCARDKITEIKDPHGDSANGNALEEIKAAMEDYRFLLVDKDTRGKIQWLHSELLNYSTLLSLASEAISEICRKHAHELSPTAKPQYATQIWFILYENKMTIKVIDLQEAIMKRINPLELFREVGEHFENPSIEISLDQERSRDPGLIQKTFALMEGLAWKERRVLEHEAKRKELESNLKLIIPKLEDKIKNA